MTSTPPEAAAPVVEPNTPADLAPKRQPRPNRQGAAQPVLEKLFELYPQLFGAEFRPLKLGVFQELLAQHPADFERESLKTALAVHTRSTRYLQSVAAGMARYGLDGVAVEPVAAQHVYFAILELFRRRQARSAEDLRPKARTQIIHAFEASGVSRLDYQALVQSNDAQANELLEEALTQYDLLLAKEEALYSAFQSSGKTPQEFADMYGLNPRDVGRMLAKRKTAQASQPAQPAQSA
jgi:sRNA-binding protein